MFLLGFQSRDLRAAGMLAVLQLRYLTTNHWGFAKGMLALSNDDVIFTTQSAVACGLLRPILSSWFVITGAVLSVCDSVCQRNRDRTRTHEAQATCFLPAISRSIF